MFGVLCPLCVSSLSLFSLLLASVWRVLCCAVLCCCVVVCVSVCVGGGEGGREGTVCTFKTPPLLPCVHSKRPRVYRHHAQVFHTCGRGTGTHGTFRLYTWRGVLNVHTFFFCVPHHTHTNTPPTPKQHTPTRPHTPTRTHHHTQHTSHQTHHKHTTSTPKPTVILRVF